MTNTVNKVTIYTNTLDELVRANLASARLEAGAGRYQYTGGNTVKIPKLSVGGYGTYNRSTGYPSGSVTNEWETKTITMDRGIKFGFDIMDQDETQQVLSASNAISVFAKTKAVPELDAYRFSSIFNAILPDATVKYGYYTPAAATLLTQINTQIGAIQDVVGETEQLICFISGQAFAILTNSTELTKQLGVQSVTGANGVTTKIYDTNGVTLIPVPSARMKTEYAFSATDGFSAKTWAQDINFMIMSPNAAIAFVKHNKTKIISAEVNQDSDEELVMSRVYHDIWVLDNKKETIYVSLKTATIDDISSLLTAGSGKVTYTLGSAYTNKDAGHEYWQKDTDSATAPAVPACYDDLVTTGYTKIATASATDVTVTATHYLVLAHLDENGKVVEFGKVAAS